MNILKVIPALFSVLRKGKALSSAGAWKNAQAVILLIAAIDTLLKAIGYDFGFTNDDYAIIADFIVYAVSIYLVFATSDKVGFREKTITPQNQGGHAVPFDWADPTHHRVRGGAGDVRARGDESSSSSGYFSPRSGCNG